MHQSTIFPPHASNDISGYLTDFADDITQQVQSEMQLISFSFITNYVVSTITLPNNWYISTMQLFAMYKHDNHDNLL